MVSGGWVNTFSPRRADMVVETMMFTLMPREGITQAADGDAVVTNAQKQQADYAAV